MSASDLSKIAATTSTINMSADHLAAQGGNFEPQRDHQFVFEVILNTTSGSEDYISLSVVSAPIPDWSNEAIELKHMNESRFVIGRATFSDGELTFYDFVDREVAKSLYNWYQQGYNPETGQMGLARDYKKTCYLTQYAPNGTMSRKWKLIGCFLKSCKWGEANQEGNEVCKLTMGLKYDKAIPDFHTLNNTSGSGTAVTINTGTTRV